MSDQTGGVLPGVTVQIRNLDTNASREVVTDSEGRYRARRPAARALRGDGGPQRASSASPLRRARPGRRDRDRGRDHARRRGWPRRSPSPARRRSSTPRAPTSATSSRRRPSRTCPSTAGAGRTSSSSPPASPTTGTSASSATAASPASTTTTPWTAWTTTRPSSPRPAGRTRASYTISQAAIREFQVGVSNFSAEFGRAAGGTVNAVTKSGTNELHGEAFYFLRDDAFHGPEPFFPKTSTSPRSAATSSGSAVGGPIKKDKAFYFVNYDEQRRNFPYFVNTSSADLPRPGLHRPRLRGHARVLRAGDAHRPCPRGQQPHLPRQGRRRPEQQAHAVPAVQPPPLGRAQRRPHAGRSTRTRAPTTAPTSSRPTSAC